MITLSELNSNLEEIVTRFPKFQYSLLDFYLKSAYNDYISAIQATEGRKLCITGRDIIGIENQLRKLLLVSDTIVFHTTDFEKKPYLAAFPFPKGFKSDLIRVMYLSEQGKGERYIPDAAELLSVIGLALDDQKLEPLHDTILGYDLENPNNSYQRNQFTLSSSQVEEKKGDENPILVGLTEKYHDNLYNLLFTDAKELFTNGNLVFSPYLRTSSDKDKTLQNVLKAGVINTGFTISDTLINQGKSQIDVLENIDIPYIENVPIKLLSKILKDEGEALKSFRKHFVRAVEDIQELNDEAEIKKELKYIQRNLFEDELDKVEQICKKVVKMKALSSVGAVVTTGIIGVSAYFGLDIASIIMAGGGTGLATANELYKQYLEKNEIKSNPMYLLWKIKSKK